MGGCAEGGWAEGWAEKVRRMDEEDREEEELGGGTYDSETETDVEY